MTKRRLVIATVGTSIAVALCVALYFQSEAYCRRDQDCSQLLRLEQAVHLYKLDTGALPKELSELLRTQPERWEPLPWLTATNLTDQWGHPIVYVSNPSSSSFRLIIRAAESQPDRIGPKADIVRESQ